MNASGEFILVLFLAFSVTLASILIWQPLAPRFGLIDHPGGRKKHLGSVPLIGGIAMYIGYASVTPWISSLVPYSVPILLSSGILLLVGSLDDARSLSPKTRFAAQIASALILVFWADVSLVDLGSLLTNELGTWSVPLTVFGIVGVVNALNMSDGMDGLAGGLAIVAFFFLGLVAWIARNFELFMISAVFCAILFAFLLFNARTTWRESARVFMGDGGSMFLGFVLAALLINYSQTSGNRTISPALALWIFAVPLMDTVSIMLRRIMKHRSPFAPDREHLHHVLLHAGYSSSKTVSLILLSSILFSCFGLLMYYNGMSDHQIFYIFLILFSGYFWIFSHAWRISKIIHAISK